MMFVGYVNNRDLDLKSSVRNWHRKVGNNRTI